MAVQSATDYAIDHNALIAGMVVTFQPWNGVSKLNKGVTTLAYGKGYVSDGVEGFKVATPSSTANEFVGVAKYEINRAQAEGDIAGVPAKRTGTLVPFGAVAVKVLVTVAKDEPVYLRIGATDTGDFSNVVGSGATLGLLIPDAKFLTDTATGGIAQVSFGIGG